MRTHLIALFGIGCGASRPVVVEPPRATQVAPLVEPTYAERSLPMTAKSETKARYGTRDLFEPVIYGRDQVALEAGWRSGEPQVVDVSELEFLGRCAREFIIAQPETARRTLISAFSHYVTACDAETGQLVLERPLGFDSRDRRSTSDAVFLGGLSPRGSGLVLKLTSCDNETQFERVTIAGDGQKWTSQRLEVRRAFDGCDTAEVPYTRRLANAILATTEGPSSITFEGAGHEMLIEESLREELRGVIDAVDAITAP